MSTIPNVNSWSFMTAVVENIKSPNQFVKRLCFSDHQAVETETIEIDTVTKGREIAPFIRKNGEGLMVGGVSEGFSTVEAPNIRLKKPFKPSSVFERRAGSRIFSSGSSEVMSARERSIMRDLTGIENMIVNAEEWMCCQALQGTIKYEVADGEVFQITYPKANANIITLSTFWNDGTPANVKLLANLHLVKQVLSDAEGVAPTDAICGTEAAAAFLALVEGGYVKVLDIAGVQAGTVTFATQFSDDGVIYLGTVSGIRFWEYGRSASLNGVATPMIRAKYVEFISASAASDRVLYFGAIPDEDAFEGGNWVGERFSKSWKEKDPSCTMALVHARPLPVTRRPNATVSMKVVSG